MKSASDTGRTPGPQPAASSQASADRAKARIVPGRLTHAIAAASLALMLGATACNREFTLSFVYAPSGSLTAGLINAYGVNSQTGALRLLNDSPIPSGGRKPTAIAAAPNHMAVYVTNHDDSTIVELSIGTDGKLYPQNTYNSTGSFPVGVAVSADGKFLYVPYTYQNGYTPASPGPGGISIFPINADASLGAAIDFHIGRAPMAVAVSSQALADGQNAVYVIAQDGLAVNPAASQPSDQTLNLFAFAADGTTGALSLLPGEQINGGNTLVNGNLPSFGYSTGLMPGGILEDAAGAHLYVTDATGNIVIGYSIAANGVPSLLAGGTASTGKQPGGMVIDPSGKYLYTANYEGTIGGYTFGPNGEPITSAVAASTEAGTGTTCVTIEPTHGIYLYASGSLSNTVVGEEIIPADGSLKPIIYSPYAASTLPLCAISVPHY